jgi:hypothetical protein
MEIDETGIGLPLRCDSLYLIVVRSFAESHKVLKVFLCTYIVAGEYIYSPKTPQENILC